MRCEHSFDSVSIPVCGPVQLSQCRKVPCARKWGAADNFGVLGTELGLSELPCDPCFFPGAPDLPEVRLQSASPALMLACVEAHLK